MSAKWIALCSAMTVALIASGCEVGGQGKYFVSAESVMATRQGRGEYFFKNARFHEKRGDLAAAARNYCLAQANGERRADAELARIGATCNDGVAINAPPDPVPEKPAPGGSSRRKKPGIEVVGRGSGFAVSDNAVVTNHHVVEGCRALGLLRGTQEVFGIAVKSDADADLAVIFTDEAIGPYLSIRGQNAELGEDIIVFGFPFSSILSSTPKLSVGVISATAGLRDDTSEYQISAPIQPGNSGGPVVGNDASVIGVTVSQLSNIYMLKRAGTLPQNVNFAVKGSVLSEFLRAHDVKINQVRVGPVLDRRKVARIVTDALFMVECWQ